MKNILQLIDDDIALAAIWKYVANCEGQYSSKDHYTKKYIENDCIFLVRDDYYTVTVAIDIEGHVSHYYYNRDTDCGHSEFDAPIGNPFELVKIITELGYAPNVVNSQTLIPSMDRHS